MAHGRGWAALGTFGIHLIGGLAGVATLWSSGECSDPKEVRGDCSDGREERGDVVKPVVILATAAVFDAVALGWDREKIPVATPTMSVGIAPSRKGCSVGVVGAF